MSELISIIVPVYNVEKYLLRCLDSICNQTYNNLEIILVDDGSTDSSGNICDEYALVDSRIIVIHKNNGGLSSARNVAIDIAIGEYIMFVDSDDYISKDCVEYLLNIIKNNHVEIAIGNYTSTFENDVFKKGKVSDEKIIRYDGKQLIPYLSFGNNTQLVTAWAKLYRRGLFSEIRYPNGFLHEDEGTTYKLYFNSNAIIVSNKIVYAYYRNPNSIMGKPKIQNYTDLCKILDEQIHYFTLKKENELADQVRNRYCFQIMEHIMPLNHYGHYSEMKMKIRKIYREIVDKKHINKKERKKGWICCYFPLCTACLLKIRNKICN